MLGRWSALCGGIRLDFGGNATVEGQLTVTCNITCNHQLTVTASTFMNYSPTITYPTSLNTAGNNLIGCYWSITSPDHLPELSTPRSRGVLVQMVI